MSKKSTGPVDGATKKTYTKDQIIFSKTYHKRRYLLEAVLQPHKMYTLDEIGKILFKYQKGVN